MLFRTRTTGEEKLKIKEVEVITTLECPQCNYKNIREFRNGDYLFKEEPCPKCESSAIITRIHQKKQKEKKIVHEF
jgi:ssDNA-binding Zn-finger/Zn-ribbon topoisomerase 1